MNRITRRQLLTAALAAALGLTGWYVYEHDFKRLVLHVLETRLNFLNLAEADLNQFAGDFYADIGTYGFRGHLLALAYPLLDRADFFNLREADQEKFEYRVVSRFLLSTDFFRNGADEKQPVRYVAYNSPYHYACGNPFAQVD
jgi:hypothetical protein